MVAFTAKLKPTSTIFNMWTGQHRIYADIGTVRFMRNRDGTYTSGVLSEEQIETLTNHTAILFEVVTDAPIPLDRAAMEEFVETEATPAAVPFISLRHRNRRN